LWTKLADAKQKCKYNDKVVYCC